MKKLIKIMLFLPFFTSLNIGAEYGFDDYPDLPDAIKRFKQIDDVVYRLHHLSDRTPQQEQELIQARETRESVADDIIYCGIPSYAPGLFYPMNRELRMKRMNAYFRMRNDLAKKNLNLSHGQE